MVKPRTENHDKLESLAAAAEELLNAAASCGEPVSSKDRFRISESTVAQRRDAASRRLDRPHG